MRAALYVGLDVGTTATKAVMIDDSGRVVARGRALHGRGAPLGRADPAEWWSSAVAAIGQLGPARSDAVAIGLSVNSPVMVPLDDRGEPLALGYRFDAAGLDGLVSTAAPALTAEAHDRLGNPFTPATAIVLAHSLFQREHPQVSDRLRWLGSTGSVVGRWLTGQIAIDPSQASYFGCFDVIGGQFWLPAVAETLGIPPHVLPPVLSGGTGLGPLTVSAADHLGLPPGIPVAVAGGDTPSAAVAVGLGESSDALLTLGTTHVVTRWHERPDPRNRRLLQRVHVRPGAWLSHGATNGGLALVSGAEHTGRTGPSGVGEMISVAASAETSEIKTAPVFLPHVTAERGPLWMSRPATGIIRDSSAASPDPRAVDWAVVEGVLFADRLVLEHLVQGDDTVRVAADLSATSDFVQLAADAFDRRLTVVDESHLSAVGAAHQAAAMQGVLIDVLGDDAVFTPRAERRAVTNSRWHSWREKRAEHIDM